jgi:hypothetical protein
MAHTFQVDDVEISGRKRWHEPKPFRAFLEDEKFEHPAKGQLEAVQDLVLLHPTTTTPAFFDAVTEAWNYHYPLSISPDHVWLTIAQGLAKHIDMDPEGMRHHFVQHEGKKHIEVQCHDFIKGNPNNDWPRVFGQFSEQMKEHLGKRYDLIVNDFSTTGPVEKAASEITLMEAMKHYFTYGCMTCCGFPKITLEGTVGDWADVLTRVNTLSEFGLEWWTEPLGQVIGQFVRAASGNPDKEFWRRAHHYFGGSGRADVTGWLLTFYPYLTGSNGWERNPLVNWQDHDFSFRGTGIEPRLLPSSLVHAPVRWKYYGTKYFMRFYGGLVGVSMAEDATVRPEAGWMITDVTEDAEAMGQDGQFHPEEEEASEELVQG